MKIRAFLNSASLLLVCACTIIPMDALAQTRPDLAYCGTSSRTGANLYLGFTLNEIQSCAPGANTQAMLVERSGTIGGNGAAWLDYLNNGGIIITEYNITHLVYNEIYGTDYAQGSRYGLCRDNAMPSLIINPGNQFWLDNPITPTDPGLTSCGYEVNAIVAGEPTVVPLGGDIATGWTTFACRQQSAGALHLLDHDWQDNESFYTDDSRNFMGALITTSNCVGGGAAVIVTTVPVPSLSIIGLILMTLGFTWFAGREFLTRRRKVLGS